MFNTFNRTILFLLIHVTYSSFSQNVVSRAGYFDLKNVKGKAEIHVRWLYKNGDAPNYSQKDLDDHSWDTANSALRSGTLKRTGFKGKGWFRMHFKADSGEHRTYVLSMDQKGASELFLNGELVKTIGNYNNKEELDNGLFQPLYFIPNPGQDNVIAIRYQNLKYYGSFDNTGQQMAGFEASIYQPDNYIADVCGIFSDLSIYGTGFFAFFLCFGVVHFLLYIFYRARTSNLLFSVFCFLAAYYALHFYLMNGALSEPIRKSILIAIFVMTVPFFFLSLLSVVYSLFYEKNPKFIWFVLAGSIAAAVLLMIIADLGYVVIVLVILATIAEVIRVLIVAIRKKKRGVVFISIGFGSFTVFLATNLLIMIANRGSFMLRSGFQEQLFLIAFILAVISIPISMSAFLAWDFSLTNKMLSRKLIEVKELSERAIEQEKEKQKMLAGQNEMLEVQVKERTKEINEQKKVIEEKNKDITDSINYAQRIQHSILPTATEINDIFKESFVLFKPRDIVSGDFYQFKKKENLRYAILADCTGHGVPGALMSMIGSNLLHQIIMERGIKEPDKVLIELHREVRSTLRQTGGVQSHDGMDASIVLMEGKKLFIASANRPVYIVKKAELTELKPDKRSIGGSSVGDDVTFTLNELDIEAGMTVYLFSDGYADQFGGEQGKKFKVKNLSELLISVSGKPLETQKEVLNTTFDNWKKHLEQVDDVSLIGLKF
jgi:serine phosphatase RsbU (regulator of sigma subunit)